MVVNNLEKSNNTEVLLSASILDVSPLEVHSKLAVLNGLLDYIHIDVMDGIFVPNKTDGINMFQNAFRQEKTPLDVHLMVDNPTQILSNFQGARIITFHIETIIDPKTMAVNMNRFYEIAAEIRSYGAKVGVAIKPNTTVSLLRNILNKVDLVLVMTVEPGYGKQKLIDSTLDKIEKVRSMGFTGLVEVDGGITTENASEVIDRGANVIVAGTALFSADDIYDAAWTIKQK